MAANQIHSKVGAGAVGGAFSIVAIWVAGLAGLDVPPEVAGAFTTLFAFGAGWLAKA